jgi:hypothetical protein
MKSRASWPTRASEVQALLDGTKTQKRLIVRPQPKIDTMGNFCWNGMNFGQSAEGVPHIQSIASPLPSSLTKRIHCPWGKTGDQLWVRETFVLEQQVESDQQPPHSDGRPIKYVGEFAPDTWLQPHYRATDAAPELGYEDREEPHCRWKPSIFMPHWASRITLEITGVRVERLHDISEADSTAEGAYKMAMVGSNDPIFGFTPRPSRYAEGTHRFGYKMFWESVNGDNSWAMNPWVWVIEFKKVTV